MWLHHTQTRTNVHLHTHTPPPPFFHSDPSVCCSSILHTQHFPPLLLHSICVSYEGLSRDEGVCMWVCFGDNGRYSVTNTSLLMSVSDFLVCKKKKKKSTLGVVLHINGVNRDMQLCSVWSHYCPCVYKRMLVWLCACVVMNVQRNVAPQVILHCVFSLAD